MIEQCVADIVAGVMRNACRNSCSSHGGGDAREWQPRPAARRFAQSNACLRRPLPRDVGMQRRDLVLRPCFEPSLLVSRPASPRCRIASGLSSSRPLAQGRFRFCSNSTGSTAVTMSRFMCARRAARFSTSATILALGFVGAPGKRPKPVNRMRMDRTPPRMVLASSFLPRKESTSCSANQGSRDCQDMRFRLGSPTECAAKIVWH